MKANKKIQNHIEKLPITLKLKSSRKYEKKKDFDLSHRQMMLPSTYNAFEDCHTLEYFRKKSVRKNLKNLIKVFEEMPKHQNHKSLIRSMAKLVEQQKQLEEPHDATVNQKTRNHTISQNEQFPQIRKRQEKIQSSPYLSPLRPIPSSKRQQLILQDPQKKGHSHLNLPELSKQFEKNKRSKTKHSQTLSNRAFVSKVPNKSMQKIHNYRHNEFLQFLSKKKNELYITKKKISTEGQETL